MVIFNSYVELPEGIWLWPLRLLDLRRQDYVAGIAAVQVWPYNFFRQTSQKTSKKHGVWCRVYKNPPQKPFLICFGRGNRDNSVFNGHIICKLVIFHCQRQARVRERVWRVAARWLNCTANRSTFLYMGQSWIVDFCLKIINLQVLLVNWTDLPRWIHSTQLNLCCSLWIIATRGWTCVFSPSNLPASLGVLGGFSCSFDEIIVLPPVFWDPGVLRRPKRKATSTTMREFRASWVGLVQVALRLDPTIWYTTTRCFRGSQKNAARQTHFATLCSVADVRWQQCYWFPSGFEPSHQSTTGSQNNRWLNNHYRLPKQPSAEATWRDK